MNAEKLTLKNDFDKKYPKPYKTTLNIIVIRIFIKYSTFVSLEISKFYFRFCSTENDGKNFYKYMCNAIIYFNIGDVS